MYKELHPYYRDFNPPYQILPATEITLNLSTIKSIRKDTIAPDPEGGFYHFITWTDDYHDNLMISQKEADEVKKTIMRNSPEENLSESVRQLTTAVRDLWNLLRARMH